jgi:hypothetical protein
MLQNTLSSKRTEASFAEAMNENFFAKRNQYFLPGAFSAPDPTNMFSLFDR